MKKLSAGSTPRLLPALIITLAVLLSLKAVALAEGASEAAETTSAPAPEAPPVEDASGGAGAPLEPAPLAECKAPTFAEGAGVSATEMQILQSLSARRQTLEARGKEIDTRTELLAAAERRVDERLAELKRVEARVQELIGQVDTEQAKRLQSLVEVYQRMRSKDAAEVFNALEEDVLVQVASRMKQQNLAEILGHMEPPRARALTRLLAKVQAVDPAALTAPPAPQKKS
jgi:flagellar motility protein MotE (MotC chaperone)